MENFRRGNIECRVQPKKQIRIFTVVWSLTLPPCVCGLGPRAEARADSVARALERPASGFSACRECCVSTDVSAWWMGVAWDSWWLFVTNLRNYGFTDRPPPPSPSRGPAVRRRSTNQVGAGRGRGRRAAPAGGQPQPAVRFEHALVKLNPAAAPSRDWASRDRPETHVHL